MTKNSEYICNICGAKTCTEDIIKNREREQIYGIYFTCSEKEHFDIKSHFETNTHICKKCVDTIIRLNSEGKFK